MGAALRHLLAHLLLATLDKATTLRLGARHLTLTLHGAFQPHQRLQQRLTVEVKEGLLEGAIAQYPPGIQTPRDQARPDVLIHSEDVVITEFMTMLAHRLRHHRQRRHHRITIGQQAIAHAIGVHLAHPASRLGCRHGTNPGLQELTIEPQIDLRDPGHRGETQLVLGAMLDHLIQVVEVPGRELQQVVPLDQFGVGPLAGLGHRGLVEPRRQHVDVVHVGGELGVFLARDAAGNEDAEVAGLVMDAVDDGLLVGDDVVDAVVEITHPAKRLRRRRDVITL